MLVFTLLVFSGCARYEVVTEENTTQPVTGEEASMNVTEETPSEEVTEEEETEEEPTQEETEEEPAETQTEEETEEEPTQEETEEEVTEEETTEEEVTEEEEEMAENATEAEEDIQEGAPVLEYTEEDVVDLMSKLSVSDPDDDELEITFSEPLDDDGVWETEKGDAGLYPVTVTVSDGEDETEKQLVLRIQPLNNPPVISGLSDIAVEEGETVRLDPEVTDEDGDDVEVSYSGWMEGPVKETDYDDAGSYFVTVSATDGTDTVTERIEVTVVNVNRAPELVIE